MELTIGSRIKHAWNAFKDNKDPLFYRHDTGPSYYYRPDRVRFSRGNERSIITSVYNKIAIDVASIDIKHVRLDEHDRYIETIESGLNECMTLQANIDQSGYLFKLDIVQSLLQYH